MPQFEPDAREQEPARAFPRLLAGALAASLLAGSALAAAPARILETGSSLLYPLFNIWAPQYAKTHPGIQITTQSTGSGTGISQAIAGIAQIGASDAYLSNAQMKHDPGVLNIPLAISAQMINYNLPGLHNRRLKLSGPLLAEMYKGEVRYWDDPQVGRLNPGVALPHRLIVPIHRSDGSGDTFIFTQYLSASTPGWANTVAYGTTVTWPGVEGGVGANGNPGMVNACKNTPYSVAYIGVSFRQATDGAGLGEAMLLNRSGRFVLARPGSIGAAVAATAGKTPPDERVSLIFAPGPAAYPIINYEYAIVKANQPSPATASALKAFFSWAISPAGGNSQADLAKVGFVALPAPIRALSLRQISEIH